jgi:penicillin-binding protein 1A
MDGPSFDRPPLRPGAAEDASTHRKRSGTTRPAGRRKAATARRTVPVKKPAQPKADHRPRKPGAAWRILLAALLLAIVAASVAGCSVYSAMAKQLPDPTKPLLGRDQTSKIVDRDGRTIADLFAEQNRTNVKLADIPPALQHAVVATEDNRFYQHSGVDLWGTARALWTDAVQQRKAQGGSTITQQYVKNAFTNQERTVQRKISEAMLAYQVEKRFSKDQILEMYLNTIYFGHGAYGIERAAEVYFGKPVGKLDVAESAMLAGVIKSPGRYSPRIDPVAARARRHVVLGQMRDQGYLDDATYRAADAEAFALAKATKDSATAPYFVEYVKNTLVERFGADLVYRGGLTVRTTLDLGMQQAAEKAVAESLNRKGDPSAALVAIDPRSGEVRAMVGGSDFGSQQYNIAVQGHRQPGSAFKPFVLVAALEDGVSPEQTFESGPVELTPAGASTPWKVTGASGDRSGPMRLREATEKSVNSVFAQLILQVGADKVVDAAKSLGIVTPVTPVPAIALGGLEQGVSPLEMASAYGTLANGGVHAAAHGILDVKDPSGKVLFTSSSKGQKSISAAVAYLATDMLKGVISKGTGTGADIGRPQAGKTGTTQAYRDAWFVGYTPQLVASVWVGYPDAAREMTSVHGRKVTGGSFPAEIWASFMKTALQDTPKQDFTHPPDGLTTETVCLDTGLLATDYCPRTADSLFLSTALPKTCNVHKGPQKVVVPSVLGMTRSAAETALKDAGFDVTVSSRLVSGVASGTVAAQAPAAGAKAVKGSTVTITLGGVAKATAKKPTAAFTLAVASDGLGVDVDASASTGKTPLQFDWAFGDGENGTGATVSHPYTAKGTYRITLTVTDAAGRTATTSRTVHLR